MTAKLNRDQFHALLTWVTALIDERLEENNASSGVWLGRTPWSIRNEAEERLQELLMDEADHG